MEINNEYEIIERLEVFDKIIRMIESCENLDQLTVCRNYFNQYIERYSVTVEKQSEFECKFDAQSIFLLKQKLKEKSNGKHV